MGLQMFIKRYMLSPITQEDIDNAGSVLEAHGVPFNREGWEYILSAHDGYLPLEIQALPEGTIVPVSNALVQVSNTDPKCAWLTSYVETALLRAVWYPTTIATRSNDCRKIIREALLATGDSLDGLDFKLHDFGARGTSSLETAEVGGGAHLLNFMGTDTLSGIVALREYYNADMPGFSIPAAEHSTITCWGRENEVKAYDNMLKQFAGEEKVVAIVSDSYDLFNAIDNMWGGELREKVINNGGTVVIRPDSGDPLEIVCESVERLIAKFGYEETSTGHRRLPAFVRVIQGDGVSPEKIREILAAMNERGLSADNVAFGMGGELLQKVDRDTMKFAMKASAIRVNGEWRDVFKDPVTDKGKRSKKGKLAVIEDANDVSTIRESELGTFKNLLEPVFRDGKLLRDEMFSDIRERVVSRDG